jgi:hypothetical protein
MTRIYNAFPRFQHVHNITDFPKPLGHIRGHRGSRRAAVWDAFVPWCKYARRVPSFQPGLNCGKSNWPTTEKAHPLTLINASKLPLSQLFLVFSANR